MFRVLLLILGTATAAFAEGIPLVFMANRGQAPGAVRYLAKGSDLTAYFLAGEVRLHAAGSWVRVRFESASDQARVEGAGPLAASASFLIGSARRWRRDVPMFQAVRYRHLYKGIDAIYDGAGPRLKSEFVVAAGADPALIRMRYDGAGPPSVEPGGGLAVPVKGGKWIEGAPRIYQESEGGVRLVEGRYTVTAGGTVGFVIGPYDRLVPLRIDPLLSFSTLLGNSGFTGATAIALDTTGAAYIAGRTDSTTLPTASPAQNFNRGSINVFVAKLNPSGSGFVYCTYMGGSETDEAYAIAVDSSGAAYVAGATTSPDFPTVLPEQSTLHGSRNAFLFKLNPLGDMLEFSTYLGGNGADAANGLALDSAGNSYLVGDTTSSDFPANAFQTGYHGSQDAFVAKLSADGRQLLFSTYLGGSGTDHGGAIAVDPGGTIYLTGSTWSADFPVNHAFQAGNHGYSDAFVARLSSDGNTLIFSTYLGGTGGAMGYPETGQGIALDSAGDAYVAGVTSSPDFPLWNAVQPQLEGFTDAFVTKLNSDGAMLFSTYMGGTGVEVANGVALDSSGAVYVVGYTYSTDFPVTVGAVQTANAGGCDGFLFKLSPAGDLLLYATYLGGSGGDTASAIALDAGGNVYVAGWTMSPDFPVVH